MENYVYENKLKNCPICGANLSKYDKECPACSANLVGYNEEHNRAQNLKKSAEELYNIAEEHKRISAFNEQENEKKERVSKTITIISFALLAIISIAIFMIYVPFDTNEYKNIGQGKTYEEIKEYFSQTDFKENVVIDVVNEVETKIIDTKKDKFNHDINYRYEYHMGIDEKNKITSILHRYNDLEYQYELEFYLDFARILPLQILFTKLSGEINCNRF